MPMLADLDQPVRSRTRDLLNFATHVPAEAWQELSLACGHTVAGRLRFAPAAPIRLALWRKPLND